LKATLKKSTGIFPSTKIGLIVASLVVSYLCIFLSATPVFSATTTAKKATPDVAGITSETSTSGSSSDSMMPMYRKGLEAYKAKNYEKAAKYLKAALETDDANTQPKYTAEANAILGVINQYYLKDSGHLENALEYYQEAVRIDPDNFIANRHLAPLAKKLNLPQTAKEEKTPEQTVRATPIRYAMSPATPQTVSSGNKPTGLGFGAGWSYVGAKYLISPDFSTEARYAYGDGINVLAARGYWNFLKLGDLDVFTGLEGGYVFFDYHVKGTGFEASPFVGGEYFFLNMFSFVFDACPVYANLTSGSINVSGLEWLVNGAIYLYPF
jgi:tetratricopeptide (TPR) repeat protein